MDDLGGMSGWMDRTTWVQADEEFAASFGPDFYVTLQVQRTRMGGMMAETAPATGDSVRANRFPGVPGVPGVGGGGMADGGWRRGKTAVTSPLNYSVL